MSLSLQKGQKISLTKNNESLNRIVVGLGWDEKGNSGTYLERLVLDDIDCDASAFLLRNDKLLYKEDVVYFGNLEHFTHSVQHTGDNLTGEGEGDDEQIIIDLKNIPQEYNKVVIVINIYDAYERNQHFGMVENAFIRVVDYKNFKEICKYNLTEDYTGYTAMILGEVYRYNGEWKFSAIGQGTKDYSLTDLIKRYL